MKHKVLFFAALLMTLAMPYVARAYDFSAVSPSGHTLYYNIVNGEAQVTWQRNDNNYPYSSYYSPLNGSLEIPSSVTYNGNNYLVTSIGERAFYGCPDLTSITIPDGVTSIGFRAFDDCDGLTSITLPDGVTEIGARAFYSCSGLTSINIPEGVTTIGTYTFFACTHLTSIILPYGLTSIGNYAFQDCISLITITFPHGLTMIGGYAFKNCNGLTRITLLDGLAEIRAEAFAGCTNLIEIVSKATVAPTVTNDAFNNVPQSVTVSVPCGSQESYASTWSYFSNFNEVPLYTLKVQSNSEIMGSASITTAPSCNNAAAAVAAMPNSGYQFVRWSDNNTDNPRTLMVTSDTTITAIFEAIPVSFNVVTNNAMGSGTYPSGSTAIVFALPQVDLQFAGWSDGETANPRYIVVTSDITLTALYRAPDTVRIYDTTTVYDTVINIVYDTTEYNHYYYDTTRIYDTLVVFDTTWAYDTLVVYDTTRVFDTVVYVNIDTLHHYYFDTTRVFDTMVYVNVDTLHHYFYDTTRVFDTMVFVNVDTLHHYYYDTTRVYDTLVFVNIDTLNHYYFDTTRTFDTMVYVNVDTLHHYYYDTIRTIDTLVYVNLDTLNHYYYDTTVVTHYVFDSTWVFDSVWVFDSIYLFDTVYVHDTIYIPREGIDGMETIDAKIYQRDGMIVVESDGTRPVRVFDATGRETHSSVSRQAATHKGSARNATGIPLPSLGEQRVSIPVPASGAYLVKIGDLPARKIVVVR